MSEISFIEKEPWFDPSPFTGNCHMYPNYMVKDGVEHFIFNRRVPDDSWKDRENAERKAQLLSNGGAFFAFYGYKSDPLSYLWNVIKRKHTFDRLCKGELVTNCFEDKSIWDFGCNLREVSAACHYRIYDEELAQLVRDVVALIQKKRYDEAHDRLVNMPKRFVPFTDIDFETGNTTTGKDEP